MGLKFHAVVLQAFSTFAAYGFSVADDITLLKKLESRLEQSLTQVITQDQHTLDDEMCKCTSNGKATQFTLLGDFVKENCGGWGAGTRCRGQLFQEVKRIAPYHQTLDIDGENFTEANIKSLKRLANGYLDEQRTLLARVRGVLAAISSADSAHDILPEEITDRVEMAGKIEMSPDRSMILRVGVSAHIGIETVAPSCECFHVKQARYFWDDAVDTEAATMSAFLGSEAGHALNFAMPDMSWTSTWERLAREELREALPSIRRLRSRFVGRSLKEKDEEAEVDDDMLSGDNLFLEALEKAGKKYVKKYPGLTWFFLICFDGPGVAMEPCCNSGPPFPRYTIECCGSRWAPCSDVYGEGFIFPFAISGISYFTSCPFGCFTSKPDLLASMTMNPSGRQWPERSCCSSHPSGSSNSDGNANDEFFEIYEKMKKNDDRRLSTIAFGDEGTPFASARFFAPDATVYDARLVSGLYDFHAQGVTMARVTLFTTALQQLSYAGLNPKGSDLQHLGLTIEFSKPVHYGGGAWRFLSLEMMAQGMMWTLNADSEPTKNYDYQKKLTFSYDSLSPKVVARYLAEQQGRKYKYGTTDCQTVAMELASRLALHGRRLSAGKPLVEPVVHTYMIQPVQSNPLPMLQKKVHQLMRGDTNTVEVKVEDATAVCPQPMPEIRVMTDEARAAWEACATPLALTPIMFRSPAVDFEELRATLEILSDVEKIHGSRGFFISHPKESKESLLHGPTHAEYKDLNSAQLNGNIFLSLALVVALLVGIFILGRKAAPAITARVPVLKRAGMPVLFGASILSGTILAPVAVGGYWYRRRQEATAGGVPNNLDEQQQELRAADGEDGEE
jgi:hypothetical protein